MHYEESLAYIQQLGWSQKTAGLQRMREITALLENPQDHLSVIHVAGSNGKGSVCAMLSAVLSQAGYHVGLFTSPHLIDFRERVQLDGKMITKKDFVRLFDCVFSFSQKMSEPLTTQEMTTAIALQYFSEKKPDLVILEVGMGGERDSTNVIGKPLVSVITNLSLDHTEYLGNRLQDIAQAKAGIIKKNRPVVSYDVPESAFQVIQKMAREKNAPLYRVDRSKISFLAHSLKGQSFSIHLNQKELCFDLALLGRHQVYNAATTFLTLKILEKEGIKVPLSSIQKGFQTVKWPGRLERIEKNQPVILDGGHNPQGALAMKDFLADYFPGQKVNFLFAMFKDKNIEETISILMPYAQSFACLTANHPRALEKEKLVSLIRQAGGEARAFSSLSEAIEALWQRKEPMIIFGSLVLAAETLTLKKARGGDLMTGKK